MGARSSALTVVEGNNSGSVQENKAPKALATVWCGGVADAEAAITGRAEGDEPVFPRTVTAMGR